MIKDIRIWRRAVVELTGVTVFASGVHVFVAYNQIVPGGVTGIASMGNYLFHIPLGIISFLLNFPILLAGYCFLGKKMILRTLMTVFELSFMLDIGIAWLPVYRGNFILASLCGGLCMGGGLSILLISGTTTGGGDLLARLIQTKKPDLSMGKILLAIDGGVILTSIPVFGEIKFACLGILTMAVSAGTLDLVYNICAKLDFKYYIKRKKENII